MEDDKLEAIQLEVLGNGAVTPSGLSGGFASAWNREWHLERRDSNIYFTYAYASSSAVCIRNVKVISRELLLWRLVQLVLC